MYGKAETSITELYKDPIKPTPSTKITRTRTVDDPGWSQVVQERDNDQDGTKNEIKTAVIKTIADPKNHFY